MNEMSDGGAVNHVEMYADVRYLRERMDELLDSLGPILQDFPKHRVEIESLSGQMIRVRERGHDHANELTILKTRHEAHATRLDSHERLLTSMLARLEKHDVERAKLVGIGIAVHALGLFAFSVLVVYQDEIKNLFQ